jgi:hypothetical protein
MWYCVPNTTTSSAPAVEIKMATFTGAKRALCFFGSKKRSRLHKFKGNLVVSIARSFPVGLQFTRCTRILLRPDVLWAIPSHPVARMFLMLQWNSFGRASFEVHESQRDVRLGKLVFPMLLCGEYYENVCTSRRKVVTLFLKRLKQWNLPFYECS